MKRDMVEGSIARAMVAFTVPLMLSGILQQLFNWVDAFIVGNVEGELALAGIGATTALYSLFVMVITGFTGGLSVLAARAYGMGEQGGLSRLLCAASGERFYGGGRPGPAPHPCHPAGDGHASGYFYCL